MKSKRYKNLLKIKKERLIQNQLKNLLPDIKKIVQQNLMSQLI